MSAPLPRSRPRSRFERRRLGPWREAVRLADGRELILRPIEPLDAKPLQEGFAKLEPEEVRLRFLHPLTELTDAYARELCDLDPARGFAIVATEPGPPGEAAIGAVARLAFDPDSRKAEFAIIVGHPLAGQGLGRHLLSRLIDYARRRGFEEIGGDVLIDNVVMLHLARKLGFATVSLGEPGLVRIVRQLPGPAKRKAR